MKVDNRMLQAATPTAQRDRQADSSSVQDASAGMWEGGAGVTAARQAAGGGEGVAGKVVEVVSGDTVIVRLPDGKDCRLSLARCAFLKP